RFRATFGAAWEIHPATRVLVYAMQEELGYLQPDRVWKGMQKVLVLPEAHLFFETLFELGVLGAIFPSLYTLTTLKEGNRYHREPSLFTHVMMVLKELKEESMLLKLTALYHDIAKPYCYRIHGDGREHTEPKLIEPRIDLQLPSKLKSSLLFLSEMHTKVAELPTMRTEQVAEFFECFNKNAAMMQALLRFTEANNNGRIADAPGPKIVYDAIWKTFEAISSYSPRQWIESQKEPPEGKNIAAHIHQHNIEVIKHTLLKELD
ncbi:MAG TPA: polynucleotide adenylyltransferase, partial [Sulfuricurvum sp.]|nr:polynucleotide adenylyltransferase [Sulfuricurvum sp.]